MAQDPVSRTAKALLRPMATQDKTRKMILVAMVHGAAESRRSTRKRKTVLKSTTNMLFLKDIAVAIYINVKNGHVGSAVGEDGLRLRSC